MLLAHELVRYAVLAGDSMVPSVVVNLADVEEAVRVNRARTPHAPGDRLPTPEGAQMPWESAVYEHAVEGDERRRRNIYASQERLADGRFRITLSVIDMGLVGGGLEFAYYGACSVFLDERGVYCGFERGESSDEHEVLVGDGRLLEMVFPVLIANHLLNTGVLGASDVDVVSSEDLVFSGALGQALSA